MGTVIVYRYSTESVIYLKSCFNHSSPRDTFGMIQAINLQHSPLFIKGWWVNWLKKLKSIKKNFEPLLSDLLCLEEGTCHENLTFNFFVSLVIFSALYTYIQMYIQYIHVLVGAYLVHILIWIFTIFHLVPLYSKAFR